MCIYTSMKHALKVVISQKSRRIIKHIVTMQNSNSKWHVQLIAYRVMSFYVAQRLKFKQPLTSFTYSNASNMRPCAVALQLTKYEASRGPSASYYVNSQYVNFVQLSSLTVCSLFFFIFDTARIVCGAGSLNCRACVASFGRRKPLRRVCCCGSGG